MYNLAGKLKHRIDIYARQEVTDELGAVTYEYRKLTSLWAAITPILGERVRAVKQEFIGDMVSSSMTFKFVTRIDALKITQDMYIIYKGQRYDIDYTVPYFKDMQYQETYAQLKIENDDNLVKGNVFFGGAEDE